MSPCQPSKNAFRDLRDAVELAARMKRDHSLSPGDKQAIHFNPPRRAGAPSRCVRAARWFGGGNNWRRRACPRRPCAKRLSRCLARMPTEITSSILAGFEARPRVIPKLAAIIGDDAQLPEDFDQHSDAAPHIRGRDRAWRARTRAAMAETVLVNDRSARKGGRDHRFA